MRVSGGRRRSGRGPSGQTPREAGRLAVATARKCYLPCACGRELQFAEDCQSLALIALTAALAVQGDPVAHWMMERGYATCHGDTVEDMLGELEAQCTDQN